MPKLLHGTVEKNKLKIERGSAAVYQKGLPRSRPSAKSPRRRAYRWGELYIYYDTKEDIFIDL